MRRGIKGMGWDATISEARARQDSARIEALFPGRPHRAVVVTDVAWPHVGGVRFWVARGATVYTHAVSAPLLRDLVERRWSRWPDALERSRGDGVDVPFRLEEITAPTELGGGALQLIPLRGIGSEGALAVWLPDTRFLWAGDYVQRLDAPSQYAREVIEAVRRESIEPVSVAAQHLPLTPWRRVLEVNGG